jgi:HAD superfamily hydrolase (TIGR01549 family)
MNIIIPLGGKGERFTKNGYVDPKPLIKIFEKRMIEYVLDNLEINDNINVFIIYNENLDHSNFSYFINKTYPFIKLIKIKDTKGAAETLFLGIDFILKNYDHKKRCLVLDCDTFYTENIIHIFNECENNMIFYTKNDEKDPIYSYITLNENDNVTEIKEKEKISDFANTGAYAFQDINELFYFCKYVLDHNISFKNEHYTSCVISEMVKSNILFKGYELNEENVFSLGTPLSVEKYIDKTYAFLFDLDGTLVITDSIYFEVWYQILKNYNITLNEELYTKFIQGNNDNYVVNTLLRNTNITLSEISTWKDELFLKNMNKIKTIDGMYDFFMKLKLHGFKICIVTNCNKKVAESILTFINMDKKVDFVISSYDCINGKPHPEPYIKAIEKYNIKNDKCIIFEDSKSGLLSAKSVTPKILVGIETIYGQDELMNYGVTFSIKDYCNLKVHDLIHYKQMDITYFENMIKTASPIDGIKNIFINNKTLKGGFIADVIGFKIETQNGKVYSQILKYENVKNNNLSSMAQRLELYEREYYFYTDISKHVNINIPRFYHLVFEKDKKIGLVLENLLENGYKINVNLNKVNIDITLKIIDRMAKLHSTFWNKNVKQMFPELKSSDDPIFNPFYSEFIKEKYELFKNKWFKILNENQKQMCNEIRSEFCKIQEHFSNGNNMTLIHGDIKSPNIFYDIENNYEPYFIDWQHCALGKGVQDLVFFIIESFEINNIKLVFDIVKNYYFKKLLEYGVTKYNFEEYENDIYYAICYIPYFTSVWFGTISQDELIDKNFPYFLITKMLYLLEHVKNKNILF